MVEDLENAGLRFVGRDENGKRMEVDKTFIIDSQLSECQTMNPVSHF